jgi:predicted esterase
MSRRSGAGDSPTGPEARPGAPTLRPHGGLPPAGPHGGLPPATAGPPPALAGAALVLLHGRGATAESILGLGAAVVGGDPRRRRVALLAPRAAGRSWYPKSFLAPLADNEPWLSSALAAVGGLIADLAADGVPPERVVVAGFSQGACLALEFAARNPRRYGGVAGLTGGLIGPPGTPRDYPGSLAGTPVFLGAGDPDPHVPWARVEESAEALRRLGAVVTLRRYPGLPHTVDDDEIEALRALVDGALAAGAESDG